MRGEAVFLLLMTASCGLFPDLGGLTDEDAGGKDAPGDAVVLTDGGKPETAPPTDGGPPPPSDSGADVTKPPSPCASAHVFCDDFDQEDANFSKWDTIFGKSSLSLTSTNAVTQPNALEAAVGTVTEAALEKQLPSANHTHIEFDLAIQAPTATTGTELDVIALDINSPPTGYSYAEVNLQRYGSSSLLQQYLEVDGAAGPTQNATFTEPFTTRRHVALDIDFSGSKYTCSVDGTNVASITLNPALTQSAMILIVGVSYLSSKQASWNVFIDDVVVDQQ
jgi:hypothetical protein